MQLILSIEDIGIKNNMSSTEESIQNEKEVKNPLIDKILTYSISSLADDSAEKESQTVQENQKTSTSTVEENLSNGTLAEKENEIVQDNQNLSNSTKTENEEQIMLDHQNLSKSTVTEKEDQTIQDIDNLSNSTLADNEGQIVQENRNVSNGIVAEDVDQIVQDDQNLTNGTITEKEDNIVNTNPKSSNQATVKVMEELDQEDANSSDDIDELIENLNSSNSTDEMKLCFDTSDEIQDNSKTDLYEITDIENGSNLNEIKDDKSASILMKTKTEYKEREEKEKNEAEYAEVGSKIKYDKNSDEDLVTKIDIQDADESHLADIEEICKDMEEKGGSLPPQEVDLNTIDNVEEELNVIHESQLEDFETGSIESSVLEQTLNDSLGDKEDKRDHKDSKEFQPINSEDIIDIADEKEDCDGIEIKNTEEDITPLEKDSSDESVNDKKISSDLEKSTHISVLDGPSESLSIEKCNSSQENMQEEEGKNNLKVNLKPEATTDPTNKLMNFKLSNMLDILSDDEDNHMTNPESPKQELDKPVSTKQCIPYIEEDDDIMLIDDETTTKEKEIIKSDKEETINDTKEVKDMIELVESKQEVNEKSIKNLQKDDSGLEDSTKLKEDLTDKTDQKLKNNEKSPLLSTTTLKSFKKNLAEMTREELEDFCILKIVESVFDKSNLGEIKSQIKVMAQNIEEYKAKAKMLTKQNRDLQVVLKSVQEEQKKNSTAITPLKITRSVGMQVLMTDKNSRKRHGLLSTQTQPNSNNNSQSPANNNKSQNKSQANPNTRYAKPQQQIPVPRLIPAVNLNTKAATNPSPQPPNPGKSPTATNIPNGVKTTPPAVRPEKRSHNKMQQSSSVTVDLTDDEPPPKVNNRNFNPSVRCVPPQSLLAPQRSPLPQNINSPKKVYIPISGPQNQNIRPGQTIMLKSLPSQGVRPRGPSPNMKIAPNTQGPMRNARTVQRHPAPLPEFTKQYQPPNWKSLPPAPELKLAKVENGIVISWKIDGYREENHEVIASYQLFAYQETSSPPNTSLWKKIGDVKALPLPMACTLTQFMSGYKYYFAVRAVDVRSRFGPFSLPGSILLLKNQ